MNLHMMDEKLKLNKEKMKQIDGIRVKFNIHGIGFKARCKDIVKNGLKGHHLHQ